MISNFLLVKYIFRQRKMELISKKKIFPNCKIVVNHLF
ncbi:hypothetical protein SLEP1_g5453 [Rubroshorea leprosula]|uniref:Ribosomal protein L32 n=1 Tax=Rubroshorea leprosula TaxID=152421 RepID=A0AAV5HRZ3_9ROSI|nr:hypothetical protein SLEP1_g5453 [Rubroshorea leprosula]